MEELQALYKKAGVPISEKHVQLCLQYLIDIPAEKLNRVTGYVHWALDSGRWPTPAKTKALRAVLTDGDWDVEITERTLPAPPNGKEADYGAARTSGDLPEWKGFK